MKITFSPCLAQLLLGASTVPVAFSGYCNWGPQGNAASSTCDGQVQGGDWCNVNQGNCEGGCGGRWCTNDTGYCNWGPQGTAASSTCDGQVQGGDWCNNGKGNCEAGCGGRWCSKTSGGGASKCTGCSWDNGVNCPDQWCNGSQSNCNVCKGTWFAAGGGGSKCAGCSWDNGANCPDQWCNGSKSNCNICTGTWFGGSGQPPTPSPPTPTPPTGGGKTATTTRFWDCSGGSCACSFVRGSEPVYCHSNAMFAAPANNPYGAKFYGAAAVSASLGGGYWMANACGKCWKVTGTSNVPGYTGVKTTLVLKGTNFCPDENPLCAKGPHFDIAAPGFDVTESSFANTCSANEPNEVAGESFN
eukprot:CCRYP_007993-RC/>CCRYP_007993-RC protein AED:0.07 eAED:0.07 QI:769/1/1/1/0.66/0.5/4/440/357